MPVDGEGYVSMNMWGIPSASFMDVLQDNFRRFFEDTVPANPMKAEYFLPFLVQDGISAGKCDVRVLETSAKWYGVTYAEDKPKFVEFIKSQTESGVYPDGLWK